MKEHLLVFLRAGFLKSKRGLITTFLCAGMMLSASAGAKEKPQAGELKADESGTDQEVRQLRLEVEELKRWKERQELDSLKSAAETASQVKKEGGLELKEFQGGARALQALNPELSVTGDMYGQVVVSEGRLDSADARSGFYFRNIGLHIQSNLDPFSFVKAAIEFSQEGAELGEAYITWTNVAKGLNITLGKFRQQLGVINRWHKHALDQFDFPLMLREPFGGDGLNQVGIALDWLLPKLWADEQSITLQVTNAMNGKAFSGDFFSIPAGLLRVRSYWDLDRDLYLDFGVTGLVGTNNKRGVTDEKTGKKVDEPWRLSVFAGADLSLVWEPVNQAKYFGVTWRTEFLYGYRQEPDDRKVHWMGGYTYLEGKVWRNWIVGARAEIAEPYEWSQDVKLLWQISPYVTWWQSPWVRTHLEYQYIDGNARPAEHRVILQVVLAAGPHKHDRY
ncbi:MAG: hypothetical protein GXP54_00520 [Deltaproteobacteria bacterium]|nr:hypothetical protein [Deltaproteobacteria bacterium]